MGTTFSSSTTLSAGFNVGVINAGVSQTLGMSVSNAVTTTIGVTVGPMTLPPGKKQFGAWGVFRQKTAGTYYLKYYCVLPPETAFSPVAQGWRVWQQ